MALTLANMVTRVKRIVPTTTMDTELQDAIIERMNYLASLDVFPFQEKYQTATLASGAYRISTPDNFAIPKNLVLWKSGDEYDVEIMDVSTFSKIFPKPDVEDGDFPQYCCFKVAEAEIWFNCPAGEDIPLRMDFNAVPDDATDVNVTQLTELAKLAVIDWAASDGFRMMSEFDRADQLEAQGNNKLAAMKRRYQRAQEEDARFMSPQEFHALRR